MIMIAFQHLGYQAKAKFQCKALGQLHGCFSAKSHLFYFIEIVHKRAARSFQKIYRQVKRIRKLT